jgi:hypothetical protein
VLPEGNRAKHKELVVLKDLMDSDFRLRADTYLVRDEIAEGARDAKSWVHPTSDVDA